jgi:biopolymer transport protein ExbD
MKIDLSDDDVMEVQMAPLIDCVFLLLIFFLVATTLKKIDRELPLQLPESAAAVASSRTDGQLVISLDAAGRFYLDSAPATTGMLHDRLREAARVNPEQKIRIEGDRLAPLESIVHVLDLCNFEGLKNVRIRTSDKD